MAMTINGMIARSDGTTGWSDEDWESFLAMTKKVGNTVIGKNTYDMLLKERVILNKCLTVVMTHDTSLQGNEHTIFTNNKPVQVVKLLKAKGFDTVLLAGGGKVNSSFLKENLIDEVYIDIEPKIFGRGIPLFAEGEYEKTLKLLSVKKLNESTIQLHYNVVKY